MLNNLKKKIVIQKAKMEMECFSFHRKKIFSAYSCTVYFEYIVNILKYSEVILKSLETMLCYYAWWLSSV